MTDESLAQFTLVVDAPDADNDELAELTRRLQDIVNDLPIEEVQEHPVPHMPGSKAGVAMAINAVDVTARPGLLSALVDAVRNFVAFGSDRRVEVAFQVGDRPLVVKALANELPVVLKALNEYQELSPRIKTPDGQVAALSGAPTTSAPARSGGIDVSAERVEVEGSVVGRDQVWSAGGHIIIAKEGAQVIINGEDRAYAEYQ
ncbi:MAG: hypothetical protein U0559_21650 [Anaerolineae bacterium]